MSGYTFTSFNDPDADSFGTIFTSINNNGVAAGYFQDARRTEHGVIYENGNYTNISDPNAASGSYLGTSISSINDCGVVAGNYFDSGETAHGFLYSNGSFTEIDDPNAGSGNNPDLSAHRPACQPVQSHSHRRWSDSW
jgi:hypothetical protein